VPLPGDRVTPGAGRPGGAERPGRPDGAGGVERPGRHGPGTITVARVDATSGWRRFATRAVPGAGWVGLADRLADPAGLDAWVGAELAGPAAGHRDLAGALIAYRFAGSLAELVVGPLFDQHRALVLRPAGLSLLLGADGARLDGVAVEAPDVAVLAGDPDAGRPDTIVTDEAGLRDVAVTSLLATFGPVAEAVRARAPFGLRGMWGTLADHLAEVALRRAREQRRDAGQAWAGACRLLDDLAARQPLLVVRPRRQDVASPAGAGLFAAKGTCCLIYKAAGSLSAACTSCPLRSPADREAGFARYLSHLRAAG
jgi:hypothetical protein